MSRWRKEDYPQEPSPAAVLIVSVPPDARLLRAAFARWQKMLADRAPKTKKIAARE